MTTLFTKEVVVTLHQDAVVSSPEQGFIWLDGSIESSIVPLFRQYLKNTRQVAVPGAPVVVYITGSGGYIGAMASLFRLIEEFPCPVVTVAHGEVCSASFVLTQAGTVRYAVAGALLRFHRTRFIFTPDVTSELTAELCQGISEAIREGDARSLAIFGRRGRPLDRIQDLLENEASIRIPTARKLGLIDSVWPREVYLRHRRIARKLIQRAKRSS